MKSWKDIPLGLKVWFIMTLIIVIAILVIFLISFSNNTLFWISYPNVFIIGGGLVTAAIIINVGLFLIFWMKALKN